MLDLEEKPRRAVLVAVQLPDVSDGEFESSLEELRQLAKTLGVTVVGTVTQKRSSFDSGAYLGSGKRDELKQIIGTPPKQEKPTEKKDEKDVETDEDEELPKVPLKADAILVDHELTPSQARNLEKETGCEVYDRTAVILDIFHRHARSRAAKAQVEIVRLQYLAPRLRETARGNKERQRGGPGGRGAGESGMELDRRKIRDRIAELTAELDALESERKTQRARRTQKALLERVALVGYTNAGKSTLMRALTGSEVYVADKLFATLDTTVRTLVPETHPRILVSDTVGFIKNLPHGLVASFKSTLDEALEASLLAHVVDASDPGWERQLAVTEEVLAEIGAGDVPRVILFNKIDRVENPVEKTHELLARRPDAMVLSARHADDVARVRLRFVEFFSRGFVEETLRVPWTRQSLRAEIFADCEVLDETHDEEGTNFRVKAPDEVLTKLRRSLAD